MTKTRAIATSVLAALIAATVLVFAPLALTQACASAHAPTLSTKSATMHTGTSKTLKVKKGAAYKILKTTWNSSKPKVAIVKSAGKSAGKVTARKTGTTTITATVKAKPTKTSKPRTYKLRCKITVAARANADANTESKEPGSPSGGDTEAQPGNTNATGGAGAGTGDGFGSDGVASIPDAYLQQASAQGTIERLDYDMDGEARYALVYVPAGYDPAKHYDVFYYMHGGGGSQTTLFGGGAGTQTGFKRVLDHLVEDGKIAPVIVVAPTFYTRANSSTSVAGSWDAVRAFPDELERFLMPAVESHYSTFADGDASAEGLERSRDHRAFGGFSMGSVTTWCVLQQQMRYFSTFVPLSGDCWTLGTRAGGTQADATARALAASVKEQGYGTSGFRISAWTGSDDMAEPSMAPMLAAMAHAGDPFDSGAGGNLSFRVKAGGTHDTAHARQYLYNALPELYGA